MNPGPPPIQDSGQKCPNCGAYLPSNLAYCANCGYGRPANAGSGSNTSMIVWIVLFILIGLPGGCLGGCFLLLGMGSGEFNEADLPFWALTAAGILAFVGTLVMLILSARKKR